MAVCPPPEPPVRLHRPGGQVPWLVTQQSRPVPIRQPGLRERTRRGAGTGRLLPAPTGAVAYLSLLVTVLDAQSVHGPDDGCQGLDGVAVDHGLVLLHVFTREAVFVDDPREKPHTAHMMSVLASPGNERVGRGSPPLPSRLPFSPPGWLSWLRAWSNLDAELLSCCGHTTISERKIYLNYRKLI